MKIPIYPCLWFDGNAKEAADYYCSVFEHATIKSNSPIVVLFELEDKKFMGLNGGPQFKINPSVSFFVMCDTNEEMNKKWELLSSGGSVLMPLMKYPWSENYGWCQDRFGVSWQLMKGQFGSFKDKIVPSLMFTKSNAGKADEAIGFYCSIFENSAVQEISRYEKGEGDVEGRIKHGRFTLDQELFTIMESSTSHQFTFNEGISWVVECDTQEEIDHFWNSLTEGGEESRCGWLKDKFGLSWQIVPKVLRKLMSNPAKAPEVTRAFMQMKKFDIETLMKAAE